MKSSVFRRLYPVTVSTICLLLLSCLTSALQAAEFIPLGFLPGYDRSQRGSVSDDGTVVSGSSYNSGPGISERAFRWTESTGMVDLEVLPGDTASYASAVSGDGSTIVGRSSFRAMIYTEAFGMQGLGNQGTSSVATGVSFDGSVAVGWGQEGALRWTEDEGEVVLGDGASTDVSADGEVIVGFRESIEDDGWEAFRWTAETGMIGLGFPNGGLSNPVPRISADGTVIAAKGVVTSAEGDVEAYRWAEQTGVVGLGWLPGTALEDGSQTSDVSAINGDGSIILGSSGRGNSYKSFIWSDEGGMRDLYQVLVDDYGLGADLAGWTLSNPRDISANGQFIVGHGVNPDGNIEAWLVQLGAPIPEPSTGLLALAGSVLLALQRRWQRA